MEQRNLEKALDVYAALITGQEISRSNPDTRDLYEEFYANAAVYDIVTKMMKKLNLNLYEYQDAVYLLDDRLLDSVSKGSLSFLDNQITDLEPEYEKAIITLSGTVRSSPVTLEIQTKEQTTEEEEEQSVVSSAEKIYTMTTPLIQTISEESAAQVTEGLFSLYGNSVIAVKPTAQQMAEYRLDEPYSVVSMQVDGTVQTVNR